MRVRVREYGASRDASSKTFEIRIRGFRFGFGVDGWRVRGFGLRLDSGLVCSVAHSVVIILSHS